MICLIAGNYLEAKQFARGQLLRDDEWFFPKNEIDLITRKDFHVLVVGTAGMNVSNDYFNNILTLAKRRGLMK